MAPLHLVKQSGVRQVPYSQLKSVRVVAAQQLQKIRLSASKYLSFSLCKMRC